MQANAVDSCNADGARDDVPHLLEAVNQPLVSQDDFLTVFVEHLALASQSELLLAALDEESLELPFQGGDLLADRTLSDVVDQCRLGERFRLGEVAENFEGLDLHGGKILRTGRLPSGFFREKGAKRGRSHLFTQKGPLLHFLQICYFGSANAICDLGSRLRRLSAVRARLVSSWADARRQNGLRMA